MDPDKNHSDVNTSLYPTIQIFTNDIETTSNSTLEKVPINSKHELSLPTTESSQGSTTSLTPLTTSHYILPDRKGWKAMSALEKSLSVSLGVVSTICVGLMIAVIVVGVKLNKEDNCKLASPPTTTPFPTRSPTPPTTIPPVSGGSTEDPCAGRPPRKTKATTPSSLINGIPPGNPKPNTDHEAKECRPSKISSLGYPNGTICLNPQCFQKAGRIIESIDFEVDPCQNFFQFACGNWIKNNPIPDYKQSWDQTGKLEERHLKEIKHILEMDLSAQDYKSFLLARQFYRSCMHPQDDEVGLADMKILVEEMTTNLDHEMDPTVVLQVMLGNIRRFLNGNYIISLEVGVDDKNPLENAIYLDHPTSGLFSILSLMDLEVGATLSKSNDSEQGQGLKEEVEQEVFTFYKDLMKKLWSLVFPQDTPNLETIVSDLLKFERALTNASTTTDNYMVDPEDIYNPLSQLNNTQLSPTMVAWLEEFVDEVFTETVNITAGNSGHVIAFRNENGERPSIIVRDTSYVQNLEAILNETSSETIEKYLQMRILLSYGLQGGKAFQDLFLQFKKKVLKRDFCTPRWETCARQTNELFGWAISSKFIRNVVGFIDESQLNQTVSYLKEALNETLDGIDWIVSNETRLYAQDKLEVLETFLGFPEWISESNFVESFYSEMNFTDANNYFQNYVETMVWLSKKKLSDVYEQTVKASDENGWPKFDAPTNMQTYYAQNLNSFVLPAGGMDWLQLSTDRLFPSIHYGTFGLTMAQNMIKAFVGEGRFRGIDGELYSWWDNETTENYSNLSDCFRKEFYTSIVKEGNLESHKEINIKNRKPQEYMLDTGALAIAFRAYHSQSFEQKFDEVHLPGLHQYTPEQLFFLAFAQSQCSAVTGMPLSTRVNLNPGENHVQSVLQNSVEFAKQWKCTLPQEENMCRIL